MKKIALTIVLLAVLSACGGGSGGTGGQNPPPPPPPPPPPTGAFSWQVTLANARQPTCFLPDSPLGLSVAAFAQNGSSISNPQYQVASDVSGAIEPDGAGGWTVRGEGAARVTVTYTGQTVPGATIAPVAFEVLRDGTAPQIVIDQPARGAMVIASSDVRVQGAATDVTSPLQSLKVNGVEQVTAAGLNQPIDVVPAGRWGLNVIEAVATDSCDNTATLSQSYLRSPQYRTAATAANVGARVPRGQALKLTQAAIDDQDRNDLNDIATLVERYLERNISDQVADASSGLVLASEAAGCPGVGYSVSIAAPGATVTGPRVRELELQTGRIRQDLSFQRINVPLRFVQVTRVGIPATGCLSTSVPFNAGISASVTSDSAAVTTVAANGRIDASIPTLAVELGDVQLAFTGVSVVDNILSSLAGLLESSAEALIEDVVRDQIPPLLEQLLNTPLTATATISGGPFDITLSAIAGVDGINVVPAATTETAFTQIHPSRTGTPYPALGAIARPTVAANVASRPGPLTYALDDNLTNQGLWALWHGGALEIPDVIGLPGTMLRVSGLLPPVLMPGDGPGAVGFGIGDLDVTLSLNLAAGTLPAVSGQVEVVAYASYLLAGTIHYDGATKDLRLRAAPEDRDIHVHIESISDGTDNIADAEQREQIEAYAERLIKGAIAALADETLVSALLPPLRFQFTEPLAGGTVDALTLEVTALTRTADHVVIDMALTAEEPPNSQLEGYLTLNNPWTLQDLQDLNIPDRFWFNTPHTEDVRPDAVPARSTTVFDYRRTMRPRCDQADTEENKKLCLPQWKFPLDYGWYCGAGRPVRGFLDNPMLDPVDYCCRLHDRNLFDPTLESVSPHNACGFVMCLSKATGFPADITERLPDVERARRQMYNKATILCGVEVQPELPAPEIVPP